MKSFSSGAIHRPLSPRLVSTLGAIRELKGREELYFQQRRELLDSLQRSAKIESAESSSRIEGVTAERERVEAIVDANDRPRSRSESEIAGYRDVLNSIHGLQESIVIAARSSGAGTRFSPEILLQFHRDLFALTPAPGGRWKSADNDILEHHPDGTTTVRFRPVDPSSTPRYVEELHRALEAEWQQGVVDPIVLIAGYVLDFLCIHPFLDGNGRMSRLVTLLLLYVAGFRVGRFISLERVVEDTKDQYYETLRVSSRGWHEGEHDLVPFLEYFAAMLLAAYRDFERRVGSVSSAPGAKRQMVEHAVMAAPPVFRIVDIEARAPLVSREMVRKVLQELRDRGKLRSEGTGKGARWHKVAGER